MRRTDMSEINTFEAAQSGRPTGPLVRGYEVIIGFETHAQLPPRRRSSAGASTAFGAEPNTQACAVDLALPGTLPVMNKGAVERAIKLGLALGYAHRARAACSRARTTSTLTCPRATRSVSSRSRSCKAAR